MATKSKASTDESDAKDTPSDSSSRLSLVRRFDEICFSIGDCDAVELIEVDDADNTNETTTSSVCYFELQEHSKSLAAQLFHRYRPDYVLIDCKGWVVPEAVATLACMKLQIPFVPVSCYDQHRPGKLEQVVTLLQKQQRNAKNNSATSCSTTAPSVVVAVTVCDNDRDPILSVFQQAGVHQILYLDAKTGSLNEQLNVPDSLPLLDIAQENGIDNKGSNGIDPNTDDLYVLFTSGTSSGAPKAVVGSHNATFHRIQWFLDHVEQQQKIGKKQGTSGGLAGNKKNRIGRRSKLTFVDGVNELWSGLLDPTSVLVSVPPQLVRARGIACFHDKCSQLLLLPSQLHQMLLLSKSKSLNRVLVSGEVCSSSLVTKFYAKYDFEECKLYNLYGQTESTGDVCFALLTPPENKGTSTVVVGGCVTIGTPILDMIQIKLQNLDLDEEDSGDGKIEQVQELILLGADQLANGYLTESGEGRQPFSSFATGDIGFYRDGQWYIQGRKNDIVKMNGIWTSPSEIEANFSKAHELSQGSLVVAVILPDSTGDDTGQQQYKSYVLCTEKEASEKFSRRRMHEIHQVPWNGIPNNVFLVDNIPRSTSGASKVNRRACNQLVVELLEAQRQKDSSSMIPLPTTTHNDDSIPEATLRSLVASALSIPIESVDKSKSFVEMGGNSATSITLLYLIRQKLNLDAQVLVELSVLDILNTPSLGHLWARMTGIEPPAKRAKVATSSQDTTYEEPKLVSHSACHQSIALQACVDATPLVVLNDENDDGVIYAGCQGGLIVKAQAHSRAILAHKYLHGWRIQADLLYLEESKRLVVSAYSMDGKKGVVLVLSPDLTTIHWEQVLADGPVKTAPVQLQNQLWVLAGSTVLALDVASGTRVDNIKVGLPHPCCTRPLVISKNEGSNYQLAYSSSDWEACLMMVDIMTGSVTKVLEYEIGPVHKDMVLLDDDNTTAWIAGSYGIAYRVDLENNKGEVQVTHQPSSSPLSSMTKVPNTNKYIVGSYDGAIRCLDSEKGVLWETAIGASIYTKPAVIQLADDMEEAVVATTTAGDIVVLNSKDGATLWRHRITAEIWSNPVFLSNSKTIVFGARDSCLHFIKIPL